MKRLSLAQRPMRRASVDTYESFCRCRRCLFVLVVCSHSFWLFVRFGCLDDMRWYGGRMLRYDVGISRNGRVSYIFPRFSVLLIAL